MRQQFVRTLGCAALLSFGIAAAAQSDASGPATDARAAVNLLQRGTAHDALFGIAFDGLRGVAVGAFGTVLATLDGGTQWQRQQLPGHNKVALLSVAIRNGRCIAVGQSGTIVRADDCASWQAVAPTTTARLLAVAVNEQGVAYAVGGFGTILRSTDWGKTWALQSVDWKSFTVDGAEPHLYGVHVAKDGTPTLVGEFELILRAASNGSGWRALRKGERSLFALAVMDDGRAYAVGQSGAVLSSRDGGATWKPASSGTEAILTGVVASPKGLVLVSGINTVLLSADNGATWRRPASKLIGNRRHQAVATSTTANGRERLLVVGAGGAILEINP
jgi:photosystem II stability/assembly factor-like uncharacterized protein